MANELGLFSIRRTVVMDADIDQLIVDASIDKHMSYSRVVNEGMRRIFGIVGRTLSVRGEREVDLIYHRNLKKRVDSRERRAEAALEKAKKRLVDARDKSRKVREKCAVESDEDPSCETSHGRKSIRK